MLTGIMYVTVYVTDQDRALAFYTDGLALLVDPVRLATLRPTGGCEGAER